MLALGYPFLLNFKGKVLFGKINLCPSSCFVGPYLLSVLVKTELHNNELHLPGPIYFPNHMRWIGVKMNVGVEGDMELG